MTNATPTTEFQLTNEIKELGISRVYTGFNGNPDQLELFVQRDGIEKPLTCKYDRKLKNISKELESLLCNSGLDKRIARKFIVLFTKVCIATERQKQETNRDKILTEIRDRRNKIKYSSITEWQNALVEKYQELRQVITDNIPDMWLGLEFELSVLRILNIHGNTLPFIGILLARPGGGKTRILRVLNDWYCVYHTDDFNARSLVSHNSSFSDEELKERIDLLPQIKNRLFQTPELAPMFTAKEEELSKTLGNIIRIADGNGFVSTSGAHGTRGYEEDIMFTWIGACVEIPFKVYKMLGTLGFKMYFFRLPYKEKKLVDIIENMEKDYNKNFDAIKSALTEYLYMFEMGPELIYDGGLNKMPWNSQRNDPVAKEFIANLAMLLQHLRCVVTIWDRKTENYDNMDYDYSVSMPEDPDRAAIALFNLAKGHALLTGRNYITMDDVPVIVKTVLSTAKIDRVELLNLLMERGDTWLSTDDVMGCLHIARSTALRTMKEFQAIGIAEINEQKEEESETQYRKYISLRKEFRWLTQEKFKELREDFVPVDNRNYLTELNKKANFADLTPQTRIIDVKPEQVDTVLKLFDNMVMEQADYPSEIDRNTISGEILRKRLVETGKFKDEQEAAMIIDGMQKFRIIERVSLDTFRRTRR